MYHNVIKNKQQGSMMELEQWQSAIIDLLRFPLAIMVVFIHMNPNVINLIEADFSLLSGHGVYNVIGIVLSHVLTHIAVPTFYLISGFLFFINFQEWSWEGYRKKMKSRVKTLLIPYILWNITPIILTILLIFGGVILKGNPVENIHLYISNISWHIFYDCHEWGTTRVNWLGEHLRMTGPYDLPLWFLRDLIVVSTLTPLIYYAIKKLKWYIIAMLFVAYISRIWTLLPGFHITAFFYFTTGAYLALNKVNIIQFVNKYKHFLIPTSAILLILSTIFDGANTVIGQNIYPFFICTGVFAAFLLASICIRRYHIQPNKLLVSSCFFIYAIHGISFPIIGSPLSYTNMIVHRIIPGNTGIEDGICYLVCPFITAFLCILILMAARRLFPKTTLLFSGNK